ncbi:MAG: hypothetical protein WD077_13970 [Bacteroidia bacterium]
MKTIYVEIMKTTIKKDYDCVKEVRKVREQIAKDTEGKTPQEILEYFRKRKEENNK